MKTFKLIAAILVFASAQLSLNAKPLGSFEWDKETHDFGTITKGEPVSFTFGFKYNGFKPVLITESKASCSCTKTKHTARSIKSGSHGGVTVTYDAAQTGTFNKSILVYTDKGKKPMELVITGSVVE